MSDKRIVYLRTPALKRVAHQYVEEAGADAVMRITPPTRTLDQNAKLWPMLGDISEQVDWYGQKLTDEEWKDVFTASLKQQKVVPGLDGGFVVCGQRTSKMPKKEFCDLIELIYAFGSQKGVQWSEPAKDVFAEQRRAA